MIPENISHTVLEATTAKERLIITFASYTEKKRITSFHFGTVRVHSNCIMLMIRGDLPHEPPLLTQLTMYKVQDYRLQLKASKTRML
jgi:hypothetical protein